MMLACATLGYLDNDHYKNASRLHCLIVFAVYNWHKPMETREYNLFA